MRTLPRIHVRVGRGSAIVLLAVALAAARASSGSATTRGMDASDAAAAASAIRLVDATGRSGIQFKSVCGAPVRQKLWLTETMGSGAAWLDYNGDGSLDLYLVNGSAYDRAPGKGEPNRLYRGDGRGRFVDVTGAAGVGDRGWGQGVAAGDIDNDGDPDLYVTNLGENVLYRNNGDGTFTDVTAKAGVGHRSWNTSAAFFDMEGDGDLDLFVCAYVEFDNKKVPARGSKEANRATCILRGIPVFCGPLGLVPAQDALYRNNGDGTFTDVTRQAGMALETPQYGLGVVTGDYDNDGDQDVYVANDSEPNNLWRNRGDGTFEDVGMATLTALSGDGMAQAGMGTDFGDYDDDGWLDIVVTNFSSDLNTIYHNAAGAYFTDDSLAVGMGSTYMRLSWGTGFVDFDGDGDQDLFIANGHVYPQVDDFDIGTRFRQPNDLFVNSGSRFEPAPAASGLGVVRSFRGAAFGDYDNDGRMDLLVTAVDEPVLLLHNETPAHGHFLEISLVGAAGPGTEAQGRTVGAVAVSAGDAAAKSRPSTAAASSGSGADGRVTAAGETESSPRADPPASAPDSEDRRKLAGSNRDAVGARVAITVGGRKQIRERKGGGSYLSASTPRLHFGLGDATRVDAIEVRWPSGRREIFKEVAADRIITLREGTGQAP